MLLNITPESLVNMKLPKKSQEQLFDEKVRELHNQGLKYSEIAKRLNASYNVVKPIGESVYGKYSCKSNKPEMKRIECNKWTQIDRDTLPLVIDAIEEFKGDKEARPKKITISSIEKILKLPCKRIYLLPMCKAEIQKHMETQEQYWAREVIWAVRKIESDNKTVNRTAIQRLTNMRKENLQACIPYISDKEIQKQLENMM